MLFIREIKQTDLSCVLSLHKISMIAVNAYKGDGPWDNDLKDIKNSYKNGIFLVGLINCNIICMGAIRKINNLQCEVKRMRTVPQEQGKGYGAEILKKLIAYAKILNYHEIMLETSDQQQAAIHLYIKHGFKETRKELIDGFNCSWYSLML